MKNKIIDFFKGFGIGISNLIPGFSGGTAAVILGVYDRFVTMFADLVSNFKETFKNCWALLLGMVIGAAVGIFGITKLIGIFPVQTAFFITGLVIASYPGVINAIKQSGKITVVSIICFIFFEFPVITDIHGDGCDQTRSEKRRQYTCNFIHGVPPLWVRIFLKFREDFLSENGI